MVKKRKITIINIDKRNNYIYTIIIVVKYNNLEVIMKKVIFLILLIYFSPNAFAEPFNFELFFKAYFENFEKDVFDYVMRTQLNLNKHDDLSDSLFYYGTSDEGMVIVDARLDGWNIKRLTLTIGSTITGNSQIRTFDDQVRIGRAFIIAEEYLRYYCGEPLFSIIDLMRQIEDENADYRKIFFNLIPEIIATERCYAEWLNKETLSFARVQLEPSLRIMFAR
jgi:hypothetical protein